MASGFQLRKEEKVIQVYLAMCLCAQVDVTTFISVMRLVTYAIGQFNGDWQSASHRSTDEVYMRAMEDSSIRG